MSKFDQVTRQAAMDGLRKPKSFWDVFCEHILMVVQIASLVFLAWVILDVVGGWMR